jgi:NADH-quinone oxidoreductase subunit C
MREDLAQRISGAFPFLVKRPSADYPAFNCPADQLLGLVRALKEEWKFDLLVDVTAIDNGVESDPRFTAVYHLYSIEHSDYVRLAADCVGGEEPRITSLTSLYAAADWHERETYDMFGIVFEGHPDLRRILMWDAYPYYPLRKDFPLAGKETEFPAADVHEITGVRVQSAPMMGGPFVAPQEGPMSEREPRAKDQSWTEKNEKPLSSDA